MISEWKELARGCPQGLTFGPFFWNMFENDLAHIAYICSLNMYADDHQLYTSGKTVEDIQNKLNKEGKVISDWYGNNLLKGNFDKYQFMTLGPKGNVKDYNITMPSTNVESGSEMRLLGLTINANLNISSHISDICKRASRKVGVLIRLQKLLPTKAKLM